MDTIILSTIRDKGGSIERAESWHHYVYSGLGMLLMGSNSGNGDHAHISTSGDSRTTETSSQACNVG
eukprot:1716117-Pyramimonas_sp.AAC.1